MMPSRRGKLTLGVEDNGDQIFIFGFLILPQFPSHPAYRQAGTGERDRVRGGGL
jgi:hypothetical protein